MKAIRISVCAALFAVACGQASQNGAGDATAGRDAGGASSGATAGGDTQASAQSGSGSSASGASGAPSIAGENAGGGSGVAGITGDGGDSGAGGEACQPRPVEAMTCPDLIGVGSALQASVTTEDGASATLSDVDGALRLVTASGFLVTVRIGLPSPPVADETSFLRLHLRATNTNTGWQGNVPVITLEDESGKRRSYSPATPLYPKDGKSWVELRVPLAGGYGWQASGDAVDFAKLVAVELTADTWEAGFTIDFDKLGFVAPEATCAVDCPNDCSGRGVCSPLELGCVCEVGAKGADCATCRDGFASKDDHCRLVDDGDYDYWPNPVSSSNGDAWLQVHHQGIKTLKPKLLALNFVNPSVPEKVEALVSDVIAGFREGSRPLGAEDASAEPGLDYQLVDVVDLRDGVDGRPAAPEDWSYENSTLYPRRPQGQPGWGLDYAALFSDAFAQGYGFEDPEQPGSYLNLCQLVESGQIHELWLVGSGDVPDASAAEVLEHKQRYDSARNPVDGTFERCAGNGCFDVDVPHCARSIRIGFVNYNRGPGCYLHSQGHGLESAARYQVVPPLTDWFLPLAGFDLAERWGLPGQSFYDLLGEQNHAEFPTPSELDVIRDGGTTHVADYIASCGNVHFPPNAGNHYDYGSSVPVMSDCRDFGRNVASCRPRKAAPVSASAWAEFEQLAPDCGGAFLVYWYQHLPGHESQQLFDDGRPMLSVWPFFFY